VRALAGATSVRHRAHQRGLRYSGRLAHVEFGALPVPPGGWLRFARHTPYEQVSPPGCLIARWYCRLGHTTISLLPDFLCSRLTGTLAEVEAVVVAVEAEPSLEWANETVRPDIELSGALRWMRRRVRLVHAGLAVIGLLPELLAGCEPAVIAVRSTLGVGSVLVFLRRALPLHLAAMPPPLGFGPRPLRRRPRPP
jgi:hypothetical protein